MNKFKKVAVASVSVVMAGTMALSFTACGGGNGGKNYGPISVVNGYSTTGVANLLQHMKDSGIEDRLEITSGGWNTAKSYWAYLSSSVSDDNKYGEDKYGIRDANGNINYSAYERSSKVTLNLAVGHEGIQLSTAYHKLGGEITMPDGNKYKDDKLKPAWEQMGKDLNITFNDVWKGWKTSANLNNIVKGEDEASYEDTDLFTTDLSVAVDQAAAGTSILNLANYLDYMPHFKAFLESNPIVYLSLLQDGMNTTNGDKKTIYVAPYFDGNDDIERYCIMRRDWVEKLLNGNKLLENSTTYKESCNNTVAVQSFMGQTGSYTIESTNEDGTGTVKIVKNYNAALTAVKDATTKLGQAYLAIAGDDNAYTGTSGNIIDIMNAAVIANHDATGAQLADLYRAYIDVCYQKEDGAAYYSASKRANLFNGYDACWDADDLAAILRVAKTNAITLTGSEKIPVEGIVPRSGQNDRTPDMVRLACQLYGARGADSRFENTYIDNNGDLQDARNTDEFFAACARLNLLTQEGLVADYTGFTGFGYTAGINAKGAGEAMMMYDYSQTQTLNGFYVEDTQVTGKVVPASYNFAPVVTPVSKWDVDGNGTIAANEYFRFTESWRSTKTGGLGLNGALANNPEKLKAALQFVDYLYSEDGQIVSTFGPMAENADGKNGFWYNDVAQAGDTDVFTYKGVKYVGTYYKGRYTPTITENLYKSFKGLPVHGYKITEKPDSSGKGLLSFTNYARYLIGSTLPVGVKDQSFENQLTSLMGQDGAKKVGTGLANGTIKGMTLDVKDDNYWFTAVPTGLPIPSDKVKDVLNASSQSHLKKITGTASGKDFLSVMNWVILNGFTKDFRQVDEEVTLKVN